MDALKKLKAEMERKKQELSATNDAKIGHLNFVRQKDVLESQNRKRQELFEELENSKKSKLSKNVDLVVDSKAVSSDELEVNILPAEPTVNGMTKEEISGKLRSFNAPAVLFGESESDRVSRLEGLVHADDVDNILLAENNEVYRELMNDGSDDEGVSKHDNNSVHTSKEPSDKPKWYLDTSVKYSKIEGYTHEKVIYKYFKSILKRWELALQARSDAVKYSTAGKLETQSHLRCKEYLKPFFKMCNTQSVPPGILPNLYALVTCCEEHDFVGAHDWYIKTAIGNSAWPIGLTMVGIHERSSREKISKVAHVMNNEQQRKYLTSLKRLMSYAQNQLPDVAPSKKVLF